jgi:hypothetical protein
MLDDEMVCRIVYVAPMHVDSQGESGKAVLLTSRKLLGLLASVLYHIM